jgi:hypothetical protein
VTTALSSHGRTNLEVIEQVLGVGATVVQVNDLAWNVTIGKPATEADLPRNTP